MSAIPVGLQLYSIRDDWAKDQAGTLKAVAAMGYSGVEFFGNFTSLYPAKELKARLDDLGLRCCGAHTQFVGLLDDFQATVERAQAVGNPYLIVPGLPEERRNSVAAWKATAGLFNDLAAKLKPFGIRIGYHNHAAEVQPLDGQIPFDVFFGNTGPDVIMQVDLGHVVHGGADPVAYLKKYPGRAATIHVSEYSEDGQALVGDRWPHWKEVFAVCETTGKTEWYIVEQETYPFPPLESVRRCRENLRNFGF
jgi:sugar phosphate isomerase/epimerase